jgi:serine/threonine protein kinase
MSHIVDRLREALAPEYQVERELARGGMGIVFLAQDMALDRPVAIKIIRPELATARAAERFLREARMLATVQHPNVVPIHTAGEADGFFFYVMDYVEGETLTERLQRGPMSHDQALRLGRDMLDALDAVHEKDVIHRDLKPSNIFLSRGRAVISDFGIAKPSMEPVLGGTTEGRVIGTLGYMSPEQAYGSTVTPSSDLYAAGVVLYEAYTGRPWATQMHETRPDWSGIPRQVVPILRRALMPKPVDRWPDAVRFRRALWHTRTTKYRRRAFLLGAGGLVFGSSVVLVFFTSLLQRRELADVAVLPFEPGSGVDSILAENLTLATHTNLEHSFLSAADEAGVGAWWHRYGEQVDSVARREVRGLSAQYAVRGIVTAEGRDTIVTIEVIDRDGNRTDAGREHYTSWGETGRRIGRSVVAVVSPNREEEYEGSPLVTRSDVAFNAYIEGRRAFGRNEFRTATRQFALAWTEDPGWALPQWWLNNAHRWTFSGGPDTNIALTDLRAQHSDQLPDLERMLIDAQLAPTQERRHELYRDAIEQYPHNGYANFLHADELLMRGPHVGVPLEEIAAQLDSAAQKDPTFAPAQCQLTWANIRLGRQEPSALSVQACREVSAEASETDIDQGTLMQLLYAGRFQPEESEAVLGALLQDPEIVGTVDSLFRLGGMYDLAELQAGVGGQFLLAMPGAPENKQAHFLEGRGLGLIGLGQVAAGLGHIDQAAHLFGTVEAQLEAAEWRVVGHAVGLPGVTGEMLRDGRTRLEALAADPAARRRALWALGLSAARGGDTEVATALRDSLSSLPSDSATHRLTTLLDALILGARGGWREAINTSEPLLQFDSAGRGGDPFARAVLHLKRADWFSQLDRPAKADSSRLWYEQFEVLFERLTLEAQASEIDWAMSTYARWLRGTAMRPPVNEIRACAHLTRVLELWMNADEDYEPLADQASDYLDRWCHR